MCILCLSGTVIGTAHQMCSRPIKVILRHVPNQYFQNRIIYLTGSMWFGANISLNVWWETTNIKPLYKRLMKGSISSALSLYQMYRDFHWRVLTEHLVWEGLTQWQPWYKFSFAIIKLCRTLSLKACIWPHADITFCRVVHVAFAANYLHKRIIDWIYKNEWGNDDFGCIFRHF